MLQPSHQAYHTLRAVLHTFRSHLTTAEALCFANVLPAVIRAIFVEDWVPAENPSPFPDRTTQEASSMRRSWWRRECVETTQMPS